jgi:Immunity protein 51
MSTPKAETPKWNIPDNLPALIDADSPDGDGIWEDDTWAPIQLTVMAGTSYGERAIPLSWQIEFQPADVRLEKANKAIEARGIEPDGYGWAKLIGDVFAKDHPELVDELHFGDTEIDTCVVWVESESTCKTLMEVTWSLIQVS